MATLSDVELDAQIDAAYQANVAARKKEQLDAMVEDLREFLDARQRLAELQQEVAIATANVEEAEKLFLQSRYLAGDYETVYILNGYSVKLGQLSNMSGVNGQNWKVHHVEKVRVLG